MAKLKHDDEVIVIAGKDKGKARHSPQSARQRSRGRVAV